MRIVFGAIAVLMFTGAAGQARVIQAQVIQTQVINGEGTFESNRGFDHAPDEPTADKPAKPIERETRPDTRKQP